MVARLAFMREAETLLPHVFKDAEPLIPESCRSFVYSDDRISRQATSSGMIERRVESLFGPLPEGLAGRECGLEYKRTNLADGIHRASKWARRIAERYELIAAHRPLSGYLPEGFGFDGELSKQLAAVLIARRKAWEVAAEKGEAAALGDEGWRTIDVSQDKITLSLPRGRYAIFREVVTGGAPSLTEFRGVLELDETVATRGGLFRVEQAPSGNLRLVGLGKTVGPFVIARALIRENGKFMAREILRRLRNGAAATFAASENRMRDSRTKVTITAGRKLASNTALRVRANRLKSLAELHDEIVLRIEERGKELAREFAAEPAVREMEIRARMLHAEQAYTYARDHYNAAALRCCYKKDLGELPFEIPPVQFPQQKALGVGDARTIRSAESAFRDCYAELKEAKALLATVTTPVVPPAAVVPAVDVQAMLEPPKTAFEQQSLGLVFA